MLFGCSSSLCCAAAAAFEASNGGTISGWVWSLMIYTTHPLLIVYAVMKTATILSRSSSSCGSWSSSTMTPIYATAPSPPSSPLSPIPRLSSFTAVLQVLIAVGSFCVSMAMDNRTLLKIDAQPFSSGSFTTVAVDVDRARQSLDIHQANVDWMLTVVAVCAAFICAVQLVTRWVYMMATPNGSLKRVLAQVVYRGSLAQLAALVAVFWYMHQGYFAYAQTLHSEFVDGAVSVLVHGTSGNWVLAVMAMAAFNCYVYGKLRCLYTAPHDSVYNRN